VFDEWAIIHAGSLNPFLSTSAENVSWLIEMVLQDEKCR
jgi:hypothetical protein